MSQLIEDILVHSDIEAQRRREKLKDKLIHHRATSDKSCATQDCKLPVNKGYRYCTRCQNEMRKKMFDTGYFTQYPSRRPKRTTDAKEDTFATKFGG